MCSLQPLFPRVELGILPGAETRSWHRSSAARARGGRKGVSEQSFWSFPRPGGRAGLLRRCISRARRGVPKITPTPALSQAWGAEREGQTRPDPVGARRSANTFGDSCPELPHRPYGAARFRSVFGAGRPAAPPVRDPRALSAWIWTPSPGSAPRSQPQQVPSPATHSGVCCASFRECWFRGQVQTLVIEWGTGPGLGSEAEAPRQGCGPGPPRRARRWGPL